MGNITVIIGNVTSENNNQCRHTDICTCSDRWSVCLSMVFAICHLLSQRGFSRPCRLMHTPNYEKSGRSALKIGETAGKSAKICPGSCVLNPARQIWVQLSAFHASPAAKSEVLQELVRERSCKSLGKLGRTLLPFWTVHQVLCQQLKSAASLWQGQELNAWIESVSATEGKEVQWASQPRHAIPMGW